jgi:protein-S-isoprenylcysteine O-methyltransferase Ste14
MELGRRAVQVVDRDAEVIENSHPRILSSRLLERRQYTRNMASEATSRWSWVVIGRAYFGFQAVAGAVWWMGVFAFPVVQTATLGELPPTLVAAVDIPLFVIASALVAAGQRWAVGIVVPWTVLVTGGLALYATITTHAGWGALLMAAAAVGGVGAGMLVILGRIPTERMLVGPLGFRDARAASPGIHATRTAGQLVVFWSLFLGVLPAAIALVEHRWELHVPFPPAVVIAGVVLFALASVLGLWSAFAMSTRGAGTPLPSAATTRLVIDGPYRYVRNPMAIAGIIQGTAVGLVAQSWLVVGYAIAGSVVWNWLVRPLEEADLAAKFGDAYLAYRSRVRCWIPTSQGRHAPVDREDGARREG